ncbi:Potassium transporter [Dillenia turbinata]|uniref:Potassium transporter n=1 Tax=Dillenia turbinata TaxID=194707 RepID=A0AAN8ZDV4_9MAGN
MEQLDETDTENYEQNQHSKSPIRKRAKNDLIDIEDSSKTNDRNSSENVGWVTVLKLAFQSIGIVYGDIGTSPLYVLPGVFPSGIQSNDDLLGGLSLIIYSLIIVLLLKYVFIVLTANDNGDGGTFAMYSLICRYAKVSLIPTQQAEDRNVSNYKLDLPKRRVKLAYAIRSLLEKSQMAKQILLFIAILGTSMIIGDGVLTPCISVLSAVEGLERSASSLNADIIMWISVLILVLLFQFQKFGTDKVAYTFSPILMVWFLSIGMIGIYNFAVHDSTVIKAFNPWYVIQYFKKSPKDAYFSLGGVVLCLTGAEALFADLGHFNVRAIRISTCSVVFPSIVLAYMGQISYLRKHPMDVQNAFYRSIPKPMYWPMFVLAVLAAIIASQALISATFSIVQQSVALGCFPRVKVVHTSPQYEGQVYVPEINTLLMIACVGVTLGFKSSAAMGHAYGIAVVFGFTLTSFFLLLIMIMIWKTHPIFVLAYAFTIGAIEFIFLSALLVKFTDGGYFPFVFGAAFVMVMYIWNYGYRLKYKNELDNMVSLAKVEEITSDPKISRLPGIALFYAEVVQGISPIFTHFVSNVPALHSVLVFVSIKTLPISKVSPEERFMFGRVEPYDRAIFRCIVRYGYREAREFANSFEEMLVDRLKEFILDHPQEVETESHTKLEREVEFIDAQLQEGSMVYLMGENDVICAKGSSFTKRMVIDYAYDWLRRCVRQPEETFLVPRRKLVKVGMINEV